MSSVIVFLGILSGKKMGLVVFVIVSVLFVSLKMLKRYKLFPSSGVLRMYLSLSILSLISVTYAINIDLTLDILWKVLTAYMVMVIVYNYCSNLSNIKRLIHFVLFNTLVLAIYDIVYFIPTATRELAYGGTNPVSLFMFLSILLSVALIFLTKRKWYWLLMLPYVNVLFLTASQKTTLSLIIVLVIYLILQVLYVGLTSSFKYIFVSVILLAGAYQFLLRSSDFEIASKRTTATVETLYSGEKVDGAAGGADGEGLRQRLKEEGWRYAEESPLIGYGVNNFRDLYGRETGLYTYTHYTPLELILGVGFLGIIFYYLIYVFIFVKLFRLIKLKRQSIQAFLIGCLVAFIVVGFYMQTYFDGLLHTFLIIALRYAELETLSNRESTQNDGVIALHTHLEGGRG